MGGVVTSKSEVIEYKAAADFTIAKKRSVDDRDEDETIGTRRLLLKKLRQVEEL